jgi:uncharacterized protein YhaN
MAKKKKSEERAELVPVNAGSQVEAARAEIEALVLSVHFPVRIKNDNEYQAVADVLRKVATTKKSIEGKRLSVTRLLDAAKKGIMAWFKPMLDQCDEWRKRGDELMAARRQQLEDEAEEARRKEEAREAKRLAILRANEEKKLEEARTREERAQVRAAYRGKKDAVQEEQAARRDAVVTHRPKARGVAIKKIWKWEQTAPFEEIALEFIIMSLNDDAIRREIKLQLEAGRSAPSIRGLRIWQDESSAVGGV